MAKPNALADYVPMRNALMESQDPSVAYGKPRKRNALERVEIGLQGLGMVGIPGVSDVAGLAGDAMMFSRDPESRTPLNFGASALGALPFVPSLGVIKKLSALQDVRPANRINNIGTLDDIADTSRTLYHGTGGEDFPWFDASKARRNYYGKGAHLAESPDLADVYARQHKEAQRILPVHVRKGVKFADEKTYTRVLHEVDSDEIAGKVSRADMDDEVVRRLKSQGYGGVEYMHSPVHTISPDGRLVRSEQPMRSVSVFDPKDVISKFAKILNRE